MKSTTTPGLNRTGLAASPIDAKRMMEIPELTRPIPGDATDFLAARAEYAASAEPMGTVPPPASLKEMAKDTLDALKGTKATVLVDKMAERLGFERSGVRLYDGILLKFDVHGTWPGGPSREMLEHHREEEHQHFLMLRDAIESLGADPTAITPSANLHAVASEGIAKVIQDPRTNLKECLEAIAIAELADNDCWTNLSELARAAGHAKLAEQFDEATLNEREHLEHVRGWIAASLGTSAAMPGLRKLVTKKIAAAEHAPSMGRGSVRSSVQRRMTAKPATKTKGKSKAKVTRRANASKTARARKAPSRKAAAKGGRTSKRR